MSSVVEKVQFIRCCLILPLAIVPASCDFGDEGADAGANTGGGTQNSTVCVAGFSPCGGDLTGTWAVQATCGETNPAGTVNTNFATSSPNCSGACTGAAVTTSGTKTYDSSSSALTSSESFQLVETLDLTPACFQDVTQTSLTDSTCQTASGQFESASCGLTMTGCGCQITEVTNNDATSYQVSGTSLTEMGAGSLPGNIDYCVVGNTMTQRRTLSPGSSFVITYVRH